MGDHRISGIRHAALLGRSNFPPHNCTFPFRVPGDDPISKPRHGKPTSAPEKQAHDTVVEAEAESENETAYGTEQVSRAW
jgi:hypothetical protein